MLLKTISAYFYITSGQRTVGQKPTYEIAYCMTAMPRHSQHINRWLLR